MRASRMAELFTIALFFIGGYMGSEGLRLGYAISVGALIWYFMYGIKTKGWVGANLDEMKAELARVDSQWNDFSNPAITHKDRARLEKRRIELQEAIRQWEIEHTRYDK